MSSKGRPPGRPRAFDRRRVNYVRYLIEHGVSAQRIADELGVSKRTVWHAAQATGAYSDM